MVPEGAPIPAASIPGRGDTAPGTRGMGGGGAGGAGAPGVQWDAQGEWIQGFRHWGLQQSGDASPRGGSAQGCSHQGNGDWLQGHRLLGMQQLGCAGFWLQGCRNTGIQGILVPGIPAPCAAALGLQGLLVSKNKCIWHAGDRRSQPGNAQDAGRECFSEDVRVCCGTRNEGRLLPGWRVPLQLLSASRETVVTLPFCRFPPQPISCCPKPMLSVPGAPRDPVLCSPLLHCPVREWPI